MEQYCQVLVEKGAGFLLVFLALVAAFIAGYFCPLGRKP